MFGATYFTLLSLALVNKIYIASCEECTHVTGNSGTIESDIYGRISMKCWIVKVPPNSHAYIHLESFATQGDCIHTKVEIYSYGEHGTHVFCDGNRPWKRVILKNDFIVTQFITHPYQSIRSKFSLKYQIGNGTFQDLSESLVHGIKWLKNKWSDTTGWQENTHRGTTALFLASDKNGNDLNIEEKLMVKQLEVQMLVYLLRKGIDALSISQLSMFVNALTISCRNPHNFYGHDLLKLLKDKVEFSSTISYSMAYLALCNAGATLPADATTDLCNILNTKTVYPFFLDIQAVTVMALSCIKVDNQNGLNFSFPQANYDEAIRKLKEVQEEDGSFGNIYTTAIVTQALLSAGQENDKDWNYKKAINYLMHNLNSTSDDFLAIYLMIPIFNGKCLSHIKNTNCLAIGKGNTLAGMKIKSDPKMHVQLSLNIGDEKDIVHTISLRVPENATAFEVMQLAQETDAKYKFHAKQMGDMLYIYNIAGIINDFEDVKFWLLYIGEDVDSIVHNTESPDKIILKDGAHIVMWYKKVLA